MKKQHTSFLKNVAVMTVGGMVAKGIGALYRIPLVGILGGYGMGLYQMAYPLFCVLLTFSSTGIPSAFSRIIAGEAARGQNSNSTVKSALKLFAVLGLSGTILMCIFAPYMSGLQGDGKLLNCYLALAPSVFLVALIAVLRGYFQGKHDLLPTAMSEIVEQIFKAGIGLLFAYRFADSPEKAASYALFAVTISELFALGYLVLKYRAERHIGTLRVHTPAGGEILRAAIPVMVSASLLPLSQTADSILLVRLLSAQTTRAVSLYGLYAGGAVSLVSLPATICYGFAAATVPSVSAAFARGEEGEGGKRALFSLALTLLFALPCASGLFFLAKPAVSILYSSLPAEDATLLVRLIRIMAVSAILLAGTDTLAACLTGMGRAKHAALNMLAAVIVKFILEFVLVSDPNIGIAGAAIATNVCYLIAFFLNLGYTLRKGKRQEKYGYDRKSRCSTGGSLARRSQGAKERG